MEKLNKETQELFAGMADDEPPPEYDVPGDPTKPASAEERTYWKKQNKFVTDFCAKLFPSSEAEKMMQDTELFRYPSADGTYEIESRFYRAKPVEGNDKPPLMIHFHGGGMTTLVRDVSYEVNACDAVRKLGVSVLSVEFRNAREFHFPAGVDDCLTSVQWAHANKEMLGFGHAVIMAGCSGGGNLAIATYIRALEKGLPAGELIDGIFSDAPCIRAKYTGIEKLEAIFAPLTPPEILQNLVDNYTCSEVDYMNPSAWPLLAPDEVLKQFPPTCLRGQEFDVLNEDAKEFYERLVEAGVEGCSYGMKKNLIHGQVYMPMLIGKVDHFIAIAEWAQFAKTLAFMKKNH